MITNGIDLFQAIVLAVVQGITELFPVSSLGHAVILPHLLRWDLDQNSPAYLPFLVALHVGTAIALLLYFWRDWWAMLSSLGGRQDQASREQRQLLILLVVGTIPAGLLGLAFQTRLEALFGQFRLAAALLMVNGVLLFVGEWLRRRARSLDLAGLSYGQAFAIGISQALALLPGLSRSGASMVGGLLVGLSHQAAARFSFLLATPIIGAAAVLQLPKLLSPDLRPTLPAAALGGLIAGILAYLSTMILMRYFKQQEVNALVPFGVYCLLVGALTLLVGV
jgi:undecaprenyl-diphosphatase